MKVNYDIIDSIISILLEITRDGLIEGQDFVFKLPFEGPAIFNFKDPVLETFYTLKYG